MTDRLFDIRQLEAFSAVMTAGSITGAAKIIGKSQSVVTRLIQDLEQELQFDLLAKNGRGITPTRNGALFRKEVDRLLNSALQVRERAREIAGGETRSIEIASTPSLAASIVPQALARLDRAGLLPRHVLLRSQLPEEVIQAVAGRTADIGLASFPLENPGLEIHWVGEASCVAVLAADDPLAREDCISVRQLAQRRLITMSNPHRVLGGIMAALEKANVVSLGVINTNSSLTAMCSARAGLGVALIEPVTAYSLPLDGIAIRPIDVSIPYHWGIITPVGLPASPIVGPLIRALSQAASVSLPGFRVIDPDDRDKIGRGTVARVGDRA